MEIAEGVSIDETILSAIIARRIGPGTRLGEVKLAELFGVSRTRIRETMMRLAARGIVQVSARRGWYVVEPSVEEAREAFQAHRIIEVGIVQALHPLSGTEIALLRAHLAAEEEAVRTGDVCAGTCLLGDFHTRLAEILGNRSLIEMLRDLTARTVLISMLYQPNERAIESNADHHAIVAALERADMDAAARLMAEHIDKVEAGLDLAAKPDPLDSLRESLNAQTDPRHPLPKGFAA